MPNDTTARETTWSRFESEALPHVTSLFRLAMWFERNRDEAEDLVQDTLKQALESFHRYTPGTNCLVDVDPQSRPQQQAARQGTIPDRGRS